MNVNAIPFGIGFATESTATSKDPLTKKSPSAEPINPAQVELDHGRNSTQASVRPVVNGLGLGLEFSVDKETGATIIKVLDIETGEVVRQIPPEEVLAFMRQFDKNGLLLSRWL
jgi:flagellar protein FlaG